MPVMGEREKGSSITGFFLSRISLTYVKKRYYADATSVLECAIIEEVW